MSITSFASHFFKSRLRELENYATQAERIQQSVLTHLIEDVILNMAAIIY